MTNVSWFNGNSYKKANDEEVYRLLVMSPLGCYPSKSISSSATLYSANEDLVFAVTLGMSWSKLDSEIPYSEFNWLSPNELKHLGSLFLCQKRDGPIARFYPIIRYNEIINLENCSLEDKETENIIRNLILDRIQNPKANSHDASLSVCKNIIYDLVPYENFYIDRFNLHFDKIDISNFVLMRGLYALIKAEMLAVHNEFSEEALIIIYIALDASFQLVLRLLKTNGKLNPTAVDAAKWLHNNFDKPFGLEEPTIEKYFEEFYEQRIMSLHPASRFGDIPLTPGFHDDYYHLRRSLREIFSYFITGEHGPDFIDDVNNYTKRKY